MVWMLEDLGALVVYRVRLLPRWPPPRRRPRRLPRRRRHRPSPRRPPQAQCVWRLKKTFRWPWRWP